MSKKFDLNKEYANYVRENKESGVEPMCIEEFVDMIIDFVEWGELSIDLNDIEVGMVA